MMNSAPNLVINNRQIGGDAPPYIIAELSGNHNGDLGRALAIVEAAKVAGADAVKLQTYTADTITIDHDGPGFLIEGGLWDGRSLYELYQEASTPWEWHDALFQKGRELDITVFSSPFDDTAVDFLEGLDCPAYKIASFEAADFPLLKKVVSTGKPVIISTGIVSPEELDEMMAYLNKLDAKQVALLHCVSSYPASPKSSNLRTISHLRQCYNVVTGLSDHTLGTAVSIAAVAQGASIIEKHFTLSRSDGGVDSGFSIEPHELSDLVKDCEIAKASLGSVFVGRQKEADTSVIFRRSLYAVTDIAEGETLTEANIRSIRPGYGLAPKHYDELLNRLAKCPISRGTPLDWTLIGD